MKLTRRLFPSLLALALLMSLAACGGKGKSGDKVSDSDKQHTASAATKTDDTSSQEDSGQTAEMAWNPFVMQRQVLLDENAMCGAVFLGYAEAEAGDLDEDRAYYNMLFRENGYDEAFDFLADMPNDRFVSTHIGQELYLIIPYDENAHIAVNTWEGSEDDFTQGKVKDILMLSDSGAPFLLRCNYDPYQPDSQVVIVDSDGRTLTWYPRMGIQDYVMQTEAEGGSVYDFTIYPDMD